MPKHTFLQRTVSRYIPRSGLRRKSKPKPKKSTWVKFMDSLENRGPLSPGSPYERWTKKVRSDMEKAGTWPKGNDPCTIAMVADYWSRLLREFWNDQNGIKWYEWRNEQRQGLIHISTLYIIHKKLRYKGRRSGQFEICRWWTAVYTGLCYVNNRKHRREEVLITQIEPYRDFNDHGVGI